MFRSNRNTLYGLMLCSALAGQALAQSSMQLGGAATDEFSDDPKQLTAAAAGYENGEGVARDYFKAMALYCKAAKKGSADAQFAMGWMYANGRGVERNDGVAAMLFSLAAAQGHQQAVSLLNFVHGGTSAKLPDCMLPDPPAPPATNAPAQSSNLSGTHFVQGPIYRRVKLLVEKLAPAYGIDPNFAMAVIAVESGFNLKARSPKNAQGLMQLIPETARRFDVKDAYDVEDNVKGGLAYLQWLLAYYRGNVRLVAAAYNAGEKAVEAYRGIPPYPETLDYVRRIAALYKKSTHPYKADLVPVSSHIR